MLYQLYEAQRSMMEPFTDFAQAASKLYSNSLSPLAKMPSSQRVSAGYDLLYRLGKDYEKPEFGIKSVNVDGVDIVIHEVVKMDKPFCELRRFKRFTDQPATLQIIKQQPVVLIVAPLSGHYATLLRDTVRTMLTGHKVYITDWKNARTVPLSEGEFHLDDYVNYVQEFIRYLQDEYGNCHVMSVCQPTVPVLAAVSLMASRGEPLPLTMTMMGGPIDGRKAPTAVNTLATTKSFEWFENNVIYRVPQNFPGTGRRVYPGFMQHTGFVAMNPDRHATSHYDYFKNLIKGDDASAEAHRKFYDEYNAVLDMDADYYLETIRVVFQDFSLVKGTWEVKNPEGKPELVKPQDIRSCALLTVEGELDDISGSGQTQAAHDLCANIPAHQRQHLEAKGAGHYGIFSGRRWRDVVYPEVRAFITAHDAPQRRPAGAMPIVTAEDYKAEAVVHRTPPPEPPRAAPVVTPAAAVTRPATPASPVKAAAAVPQAAPRRAAVKPAARRPVAAKPLARPAAAKPAAAAPVTRAPAKAVTLASPAATAWQPLSTASAKAAPASPKAIIKGAPVPTEQLELAVAPPTPHTPAAKKASQTVGTPATLQRKAPPAAAALQPAAAGKVVAPVGKTAAPSPAVTTAPGRSVQPAPTARRSAR